MKTIINRERKHTIYFCYPMVGLKVVKSRHDEELFDGVVVLNEDNLRTIIQTALVNLENKRDDSVEYVTSHVARKGPYLGSTAYLAVKVLRKYSLKNILAKDINYANMRARQIGALLTFCVMEENKKGNTCALLEQIGFHDARSIAFDMETGNYRCTSSGGYSIGIGFYTPIPYSIALLRKCVLKRKMTPLTNIVLDVTVCHESFINAVKKALVLIADSMVNPHVSNKLLYSYIALEILLGKSRDSRQMARRIEILTKCSYERILQVIEVRNKYVHQATNIHDDGIIREIFQLACKCLVAVAHSATIFKSKEHYMDYIDLLSTHEQYRHKWKPNWKPK